MTPERQQFITILISTLLIYTSLAYVAVTPRPQEEFFQLYVLGPGKMIEDYYPNDNPNITRDTEVYWFLGTTSLMTTTQLTVAKIKLGNKTTAPPNSTLASPAPLPTLLEIPGILTPNETNEIPLNWTITDIQQRQDTYILTLNINGEIVTPIVTAQHGLNYRLIIELWTLDTSTGDMIFGWITEGERRSAWLQIWFNATLT